MHISVEVLQLQNKRVIAPLESSMRASGLALMVCLRWKHAWRALAK
jgi:hypothetical protein